MFGLGLGYRLGRELVAIIDIDFFCIFILRSYDLCGNWLIGLCTFLMCFIYCLGLLLLYL